MKTTKYNTNIEEMERVFKLAGKDKKMIIENEDKMVVVCQLNKEQAKKIKEIFFFQII
ncbi:hypothetical protein MYX76_14245 [Desulfobacterota bacterium AH_259_B03_O07]|nr:hypothetical protein [Desulfobacterota bacterium AH_259_B03_O07]